MSLISVEDALSRVLANIAGPLGVEPVPLAACAGRTLADLILGRDTELTPGSIVVVPRSTVGSAMPAEDADRMIVELPLGVVGLTADQIGEVSGVDLRERTSLAVLLQSVLGGVMDSELSLRDEVDVIAPVADLLKVTLLSALTPDRATTRYPLAEQIVTTRTVPTD